MSVGMPFVRERRKGKQLCAGEERNASGWSGKKRKDPKATSTGSGCGCCKRAGKSGKVEDREVDTSERTRKPTKMNNKYE